MTSTRRGVFAVALSGMLGFSTVCRSAPATPPSSPTAVTPAAAGPASAGAPLTVLISDLHFGLGKLPSGEWNPLEDFRWSNALKGFLREISRQSGSRTTLVVAGDMLEMWQHPAMDCASGDADHGCTVEEMTGLAETIFRAHQADLEELGRFASDGDNRLVIIPGNHDAALLAQPIRDRLFAALKAKPGRAVFADTGVWGSPDRRIVAEHGHQMPNEQINGWKTWPAVTERFKGKDYFLRPWGEYFVHKLYDSVETENSLIDNLIPQSNGVRHYMKQKGTVGSARDVARFLSFNIGEASILQVGALNVGGEKGPPAWDVAKARTLGWKLYASAAPLEAYRAELQNVSDPKWDAVRSELDLLARDRAAVSDEDIRSLCDKSAANASPGVCPRENQELVISTIAGAIPGASYRAVVKHLGARAKDFPEMRVFVYGHTHTLQCPTAVTPERRLPVAVANTGAFQRLIDDAKFVAAAGKKNLTPEEGLRRLTLEEDAPPCYSAVLVTYADGRPVARVQNWYMAEGDVRGEFVDPGDCRCAKLGSPCGPEKKCD